MLTKRFSLWGFLRLIQPFFLLPASEFFTMLLRLPSHISHRPPPDRIPVMQPRRRLSLQAHLAELMLVNRLRVRTRPDLALDTLQRGAAIIELTARHWFADAVFDSGEGGS